MVDALHLPRIGASSERSYVLEGIRKKDQHGHLGPSHSAGAEANHIGAPVPEGAAPGAKAAAGDDWVINIGKKEAAAAAAYGQRTS